MSASDKIARLRELRAKATAGPWVTRRHKLHDHEKWGPLVEIGQREEQIGDSSAAVFGPDEEWIGDNVIVQVSSSDSDTDAAAIVAAMNSLDALLECAEAVQALIDFDALPGAAKRPDVFEIRVRRKARAALDALSKDTP
jgi:hypothetical protein